VRGLYRTDWAINLFLLILLNAHFSKYPNNTPKIKNLGLLPYKKIPLFLFFEILVCSTGETYRNFIDLFRSRGYLSESIKRPGWKYLNYERE
jgi:hypothetical protein